MTEISQPTGAERRKTLFSAVQPSGTITLGNYIGALRNFTLLENEFDCLFCVADLHALTVRQEPAQLRRRSLELAALFVACGLDPQKSLIYCQSHVSAHAELSWLLSCFTYMGELSRMTQFKEKSEKHADNINAGLFTYPVLMAADILLFQTDVVPVGADQKQHLEIARDIAERVNNIYPNLFTVPEPYIAKLGARVMSLQDPARKMSKSDPEDCYIAVLDDADTIARKVRRAVTDSDGQIAFDPEHKPGVSNLLSILTTLSGETMEQVTQRLVGKGYGALKSETADVVIAALSPIQKRFSELMSDKKALEGILSSSADRARQMARRTLSKFQKKLGLYSL